MYNVYPMYLCTAFKRRQGDVRSPLRSAVFPEGSMKNLMKAVAGHLPIPSGRSILSRYCKVASSNTSRYEAHAGFFRLLMKGIFDPYVLWPFDKLIS